MVPHMCISMLLPSQSNKLILLFIMHFLFFIPLATTPRIKEYDISNIPGMGMAPTPPAGVPLSQTHHSHAQHNPNPVSAAQPEPASSHLVDQARERHPMGQSYTKEPYLEDRVLTPSRFRNHSKPRDEPNSPRREFGTQTCKFVMHFMSHE